MAEWQDMATAPKDGTEIVLLGRLPGTERIRACVTRWHSRDRWQQGWIFSAPGYEDTFLPMYWIEMPDDVDMLVADWQLRFAPDPPEVEK